MSDLSIGLVKLEQTWLRLGMPQTEWLASGLPHDETRRLLASEALAAPSEVLEWFAWHDGVREKPLDLHPFLGPSGFEPLSLARAMDERRAMLEIAEYLESTGQVEEEGPQWRLSWLPIGRDIGGRLLAADLTDADPVKVPVRAVDTEDTDFRRVRANSLQEVVEFWLGVLETYCRWSSAKRDWDYDFATLPLEIRLRDLL